VFLPGAGDALVYVLRACEWFDFYDFMPFCLCSSGFCFCVC